MERTLRDVGRAYLDDCRSDVKSATGPRCISLSGLTIELMLVIWLQSVSSTHTAMSRC